MKREMEEENRWEEGGGKRREGESKRKEEAWRRE